MREIKTTKEVVKKGKKKPVQRTEKDEPTLHGLTIFTHALADKICDQLAQGISLNKICKQGDMPCRQTIYSWIYHNTGEVRGDDGQIIREGFLDKYTRARNIGLDVMADNMLEMGEDGFTDAIHPETGERMKVLSKESVMLAKIRADNTKWYLSKIAPKKYGGEALIKTQMVDKEGNPTDLASQGSKFFDDIAQKVFAEFEKTIGKTNE